LLTEAERTIGSYPAGYLYTIEADTRRAAFNAWMIDRKKPRFHTGYFSVLDEIEHEHGPYTREAFDTIEAIDGMIGTVWRAAVRADPRTVLCVVSDHGFARYDRALHVNTVLRDAGLIELDAQNKLKSWRAIGWGSGAVMLNELNDTAARSTALAALQKLAADPANGVARIIDGAEARKLGGFPDAAFVVFVKPGWTIGGALEGPALRSTAGGGTHGLSRDFPEMDASFFIAGPGVPPGKIADRIDMRDIAPTLAHLLGVSLPAAEGKNLFE
jgi:predicted AlkP superfamily pyrophosphatase or phosphodiesterase